MKLLRSRARSAKVVPLAAALFALCAFAPALASGGGGSYGTKPAPAAPDATASAVPTVFMKADKKGLRFEGPATVIAGEDLRVANKSNPKQVGPHTFSLVTKGSLPKTRQARRACFSKGHICLAIAHWHGVKGNGPVKQNPATAGAAGWDTLGSVSKKGDSWFTGEKAGTSYTQEVSADTSAGPTRLYFLCAIHPEMQGSINVLPAG